LPVPLAPQTIKLNCIPFFTFFFRRILCTRHRRLAALSYLKSCFLIDSIELDEGSSIIPHSWGTTWWAVRSIIARPEVDEGGVLFTRAVLSRTVSMQCG
jgi:hypothetical protein